MVFKMVFLWLIMSKFFKYNLPTISILFVWIYQIEGLVLLLKNCGRIKLEFEFELDWKILWLDVLLDSFLYKDDYWARIYWLIYDSKYSNIYKSNSSMSHSLAATFSKTLINFELIKIDSNKFD